MAEVKINEICIIGLPTCDYAFNSSRMVFIAAPSDEEFTLEITLLTRLLEERGYEVSIALRETNPAKLAFCTKICSKIIQSQFCIALLNPSSHAQNESIKIPNPNVHLEYGMMLSFNKYIIPFQEEAEVLPFNIQGLDTVKYTKASFEKKAIETIDEAILSVGSISHPTEEIVFTQILRQYIAVRGLRVSEVRDDVNMRNLYNLGKLLGFNLLDGEHIVYLGIFDIYSPKEIVFRLKMLLRNLNKQYQVFEEVLIKSYTPEQIEGARIVWGKIKVEILIPIDVDKERIKNRVEELTEGFNTLPWVLLNQDDLKEYVDIEYDLIGDV
jgi:hypothetical protein